MPEVKDGANAQLPQLEKLTVALPVGADIPPAGNDVEKAILAHTGTKLELQWTPNLNDKLPIMIASGDLPMAVSYGASQLKLPYLVNALRSDMFWDLTPYLKSYPNLAMIDPLIYNNVSLDGKVYGLPKVRDLSREGFHYRKDWAERLGIKEPQTIDELYAMLKAFAKNDPDGNGKDDTWGVAEHKRMGWMTTSLPIWFGAPNKWAVRNGSFVAAETTPEYLEMLKFLKRLYDEKIMNPDFAVIETPQFDSYYNTGKAGAKAGILESGEAKLQASNKNARGDLLGWVQGPAGKRTYAGTGSNGVISFPKSVVKTENELKQVLAFFDKLSDEKMATLNRWGLENVHYRLSDGVPEFTDTNAYTKQVRPYWAALFIHDAKAKQGKLSPLEEKAVKLKAEAKTYAVGDPAQPLISETYTQIGGQLDKMLIDGSIKFIMGQLDEKGWAAEIEKWRKAGGDKVAAEYAVEYAKTGKK